jgi:serine/threonine-protein kinase RsbW
MVLAVYMPFDPREEESRVAADPITLPGLLDDGHPSRSEPINESVRLGPEVLGSTLFADDAELIVGELAGNAIRHTLSGPPDGHFTVEITLTSARYQALNTPSAAGSILITIYDLGGGGIPQFGDGNQRRDSYEENGRGLAIVTAIADRIGYQGTPATGHRVWAYLSTPSSPSKPP